MRPKRLISLLVAVCMMITMLPLSAVTAFAEDTSSSTGTASYGNYAYDYTINTEDGTATITKFRVLVDGLYDITIPTELGGHTITAIGNSAFTANDHLRKVTIPDSVTSIGTLAFSNLSNLTTLSLGKGIKTIGEYAFFTCNHLPSVTIPQSVTSIGHLAFGNCGLHTLTIKGPIESMGSHAFAYCAYLKSITLPAGFTSFGDSLLDCSDEYVIYYNGNEHAAKALLENPDNAVLTGHKLLYLCNVIFDAKGGNLTDPAEVPVYKTEKITDTKANELTAIKAPTRPGYNFTGWYTTPDGKPEDGKFDVDNTAITKDITLYAGWEFDSNALSCHPLTVTGGTVTVKYDGSDVTSKLNSNTDAATGQKTYYVPDNAEVTVTLDKTAVPNGKVFDGWSTSLPTGQDYKAESITFPMSSGVNVSAKYRDAATDHTPGTAVCHPLTVTGGIVTVKNGDKDVTDTLTVTTDEATGQKTYSVPEGATVTVTLDKTLIPEGMVFDIWSTGKFSLPLGQDYKAETITFPMSSDVDIAAQYRDATIEDDGPGVLGTAAIIGTAAVGTAVLGYQAYSLGAEFAGKLMALPYFPSNRSALAMMLWEDAGKPMPESELLYPDVGQEERDMDLQHAARWAMENELIPDLNDEGTAPEEMKFFPANPVSKLDVLNAWQKAQELKNN